MIWDECTDEDVVEYALRTKAVNNMSEKYSNVKLIYFPKVKNKNKKESIEEACFMITGHHTMMDGVSGMKCVHTMSDQVTERMDFTPFSAFMREIKPLQWLMMYCLAPFAMWQAMGHNGKKGKDVNCIRQHDIYMDGNIETRFS